MNNKTNPAVNPLLVLLLGACPAMGASASVKAALGMGGAVLVIILLSSLIVSALRKLIPQRGGFAAVLLIVAGVASMVQLLMNAFLPGIYNMLGIYLAVAAVDMLIFGGAETGAGFGRCLGAGLCFAAAVLIMAVIREVLGAGSFAGIDIAFFQTYRIPTLTQASGGFFVFALLCAAVVKLYPSVELKAEGFAAAAAGLEDAGKAEEE